jgi:predicted outer membrane repeat protein
MTHHPTSYKPATGCWLASLLVMASASLAACADTHYVNVNSTNPVSPYTNWATAARVIQQAVDVSTTGDTVLVTNEVYATGGRAVFGTMTNRVAVGRPVVVRSLNGPEVTVIQGYQVPVMINGDGAIRCVYLTNGAAVSGITLTNGATLASGDDLRERSGGGVWCESTYTLVTNCTLIGNSAYSGGGGAYRGTLNDCTLTGNYGGGASGCMLNSCTLAGNYGRGASGGTLNNCTLTGNYGGGADGGTLNNCTLVGNSAEHGGGAFYATLNNCTLSGNTAYYGFSGASGCTLNNCIVYFNEDNFNYESCGLNYCCTTPWPGGVGNITTPPLFVDANGWSNLRLQANSPCINAGKNVYAPGLTDLDGNPRIVSGTVDMGAYEYQGSGSVISYAWLQQYGLPTDSSVDYLDLDGDGRNTWQEWRCLTCPTNALSVLRLVSASPAVTNVSVTWQSVAGVNYFLECSTNLAAVPVFRCVATNLPGQAGTTSYTDTNAASLSPLFYRVGGGN